MKTQGEGAWVYVGVCCGTECYTAEYTHPNLWNW